MEPRMNTGVTQPAGQPAPAGANREAAKHRSAFNRRDRRPSVPSQSHDRARPVTGFRATTRPDRRQRPIEPVSTGLPTPSAAAAPAWGHLQ
jgi:hypothetical protein